VRKCFEFLDNFWPRMLKVVFEDSVTVGGACAGIGLCPEGKTANQVRGHNKKDAKKFFLGSATPCASPPTRPSIFTDYSFLDPPPVNWDDRYLLANAMASDFTLAILSERIIVFFYYGSLHALIRLGVSPPSFLYHHPDTLPDLVWRPICSQMKINDKYTRQKPRLKGQWPPQGNG
jgi:hypothetical protein